MTFSHLRKRFFVLLPVLLLLTACDGGGGSSSAPDLVNCPDDTGVGGQMVELACTAKTTSPMTLQWEVADAQGNPVQVSANGLTASFVPATVGTFKGSLRATAGDDTETETFDVVVTNPPPKVECPAPVTGKVGREVVVDCRASDFSERPLAYAWKLTPPASVGDVLTKANEEDAVFTPSATGQYLLELTVSSPDNGTASASVQVNVSPAAPWKIVAIGDSITQSNLAHPSYRYRLWKKLIDGNYDFDLIGSQNKNSNQTAGTETVPGPQVGQDPYKGKGFDPDHEGYWGETAGEVLTRLQGSLPTLDPPDVALIHLGTNDMRATGGTTETKVQGAIAALESIIDELRTRNPQVRILIAKIIPYTSDTGAVVPLNDVIDKLDEGRTQPPVIIVDQYTDFDPAVGADTFDGIHPNDSGEEKIATKFFDELEKLIH